MKHSIIATAAAALAIAGCGQAPTSETETNAGGPTVAADAGRTYSGSGKMTAVTGEEVTIQHGPIEGLGWPAMAMTFSAPGGMADGVAVGSEVDFSFQRDGGTSVLSSLRKR